MVSARSYTVVLALVLLVAAPPANAAFPGGNGILAWSEGAGINGLDPGSSTPHLIVDVPGGSDRGPAWSADGQRIAFVHHQDGTAGSSGAIWVANADGTGAMQITTSSSDSGPSWSPDGQKIAFSRSGNLFVVDADGSNLTGLATNGTGPSWSPDGSKIAFQRSGDQIWIRNTDGSGQAFLGNAIDPDWSPNGEELVVSDHFGADPGLRRLFLDGTETPSLTPSKPGARQPAFSPDGTQIAFTAFGATTENVFTTGYVGGAIVTPPGGTNRNSPAWQPVTPVPPAEPYVHPKGATPMYASLVPAYRACESPDREHGPPLVFGSCSSPSQTSTTATVGTPDANGAAAKSVGYVRFDAVPGNPGPPDEADVNVTVDVTDVRFSSNNADYSLSLDLPVLLRLTGKETPSVSSTLADVDPNTTTFFSWPLRVQAPCATNSDPTIGSHCSIATTLDAVLPGSVPEGRRSIWGLEQVRVYDSGPDGDVSTTDDNELFAVQGIFVP